VLIKEKQQYVMASIFSQKKTRFKMKNGYYFTYSLLWSMRLPYKKFQPGRTQLRVTALLMLIATALLETRFEKKKRSGKNVFFYRT
jgi:hypothetical protein